MKILILSDSHASLSFMRLGIRKVRPDAVVHLGDYYDDGQAMAQEYPHLRLWQVPGNCDRTRCPGFARETLCVQVCGVRLFMTHGHRHNVKLTLTSFLADARRMGAQAAVYGHTHCADCHVEADGLWVLNPGSCGGYGGSAGVIETDNNEILTCRILRQEDLEDII